LRSDIRPPITITWPSCARTMVSVSRTLENASGMIWVLLLRVNCLFWVTTSVTIGRSEEHTSELQSLMRISYAVFCLKNKNTKKTLKTHNHLYIMHIEDS